MLGIQLHAQKVAAGTLDSVRRLWSANDYDDQTMLWLVTMLIRQCSDKLCEELDPEVEFTRPPKRSRMSAVQQP